MPERWESAKDVPGEIMMVCVLYKLRLYGASQLPDSLVSNMFIQGYGRHNIKFVFLCQIQASAFRYYFFNKLIMHITLYQSRSSEQSLVHNIDFLSHP